jgi:DNA/RNA endonuclease YhcR with UshA esterase domain
MDEPLLKKLCIAGSILSLFLVFVMCSIVQPAEMDICGLSAAHVGKAVSVEGTVESVRTTEGGDVFFTLASGGCEVSVVLWRDTAAAMSMTGNGTNFIAVNSTVRVSGSVEAYRGRLQIAVSRPSVDVM